MLGIMRGHEQDPVLPVQLWLRLWPACARGLTMHLVSQSIPGCPCDVNRAGTLARAALISIYTCLPSVLLFGSQFPPLEWDAGAAPQA